MSIRGVNYNKVLRWPMGLTGVLLVVGGCLGAMLVLLGTHYYGAAVTPDSAVYIASANSLLAGEGYLGYDGAPTTEKPPLYPVLLAIGSVGGTDPMETARVLHSVVFGLLVILAGLLFFSHLRSPTFAWIGFLTVLLSWPLLQVAMKVWSELVFVFLSLLFILFAAAFLTRPTWPRLIFFAVPVALAAMQRYVGLALAVAGVGIIFFFLTEASMRRRILYVLGFCLLAVGPLIPWLIRNYGVDSTLTGGRPWPAELLLTESGSHLAVTLTTWLVPPGLPTWVGVVLGISLLTIVIVGFRGQDGHEDTRSFSLDRVMLSFVVVYTVSVLTASMLQVAALPDNRILSPLYIPLVYLVLAGIERAITVGARFVSSPPDLRRVVTGFCVIWLLFPAVSVAMYISIRVSYDTNVWHHSALIQWMDENPSEDRLLSNQAWVVYLLTNRYTGRLPDSDLDVFLARDVEEHGQPCLLVWFYGSDRGHEHASRMLRDFFSRVTESADDARTEGLTAIVLDFMGRSNLVSQEPSGETRLMPAIGSAPPVIQAGFVRSFDDGSLYIFPSSGVMAPLP
jgi:hypothetical protein